MGCGSSGPSPGARTRNQDQFSSDHENKKLNSGASSANNSTGSIRSFFSFASFILQTETPQIFEWLFKKEIGKGALSRVFLAENTETKELAAAKVYNKSMLLRQTLGGEDPPFVAVQREIEILASISHRYVLPIIEVIEDDYSNSLIMMMPYAEKGSLQSYLDSLGDYSEELVAIAFHQTAEALRYVHSKNIVHRDIKPENILVFSDTFFCLSDFSVSTTLDQPDQRLIDTRGSPAFLSPEECGGDQFLPKPADVWAFGVSLYSVIFKKLPFNLDQAQGKTVANTIFAVTELLTNGVLEIPEGTNASPEVIDLIQKTLAHDPLERPTFAEIVQHPFFNQAREVDETNLLSQTIAEEEEEAEVQRLNGEGIKTNTNTNTATDECPTTEDLEREGIPTKPQIMRQPKPQQNNQNLNQQNNNNQPDPFVKDNDSSSAEEILQ